MYMAVLHLVHTRDGSDRSRNKIGVRMKRILLVQTDMMEKWLKITMFSLLNQLGIEIRNELCDWLIPQLRLMILLNQFTQATES